MAAELHRLGDTTRDWMLHDVAAGHVFAAGHAEAGNDVPVALSTARAERVEGGYKFFGHKHFGSLSPVWSRFGVHAMDVSDPANPVIVHGFVDRDDPGFEIVPTWDTLGMRATQSHDTKLNGVFVPDDRIGAVLPAGDNTDPWFFVLNIWPLTLIANVYVGIAERAFELAVEAAKRKTSIGVTCGSLAYHPMIQHRVSEMYLELDAMRAVVDRLPADFAAWCRPRRALGDADPVRQVARHRGRQARSRHRRRRRRWAGDVQDQRARTSLPRRPGGRVPSRHRGVHARGRRQDRPRCRRRSAALVNVSLVIG